MNLGILKNIRKKLIKKEEKEQKIEFDLSNVHINKEENDLLEEATKNFFPTTGRWSSSEFAKDENCLLCHLRDEYWLAKRLEKNPSLKNIDYKKIVYFIKKNEFFSCERYKYEQKVVKWQINFILQPGSEGWICDERYGGDCMFMFPNCDIGFRKAVKDTLLAVGMNENAIEEGIEKNINLWLDKMINLAFCNKYDNYSWNMNFFDNNIVEIPPASNEHKEAWILLRKCQYYYEHLKSIMQYGKSDWIEIIKTLPNTQEQLELELKVKNLNSIRLAEIEEYKQKREDSKRKLKE